jgi:hypothetical protein
MQNNRYKKGYIVVKLEWITGRRKKLEEYKIPERGVCIAEGCKRKVARRRKNNKTIRDEKGNVQYEKFCSLHLRQLRKGKSFLNEDGTWSDKRKHTKCKIPGCTRPGQIRRAFRKKTGKVEEYETFPKGFCEYHYFQYHPRRGLINKEGKRVREKFGEVRKRCIVEECRRKAVVARKNNKVVFDKKGNIKHEKFCSIHLRPHKLLNEDGTWKDGRKHTKCKIPGCKNKGVIYRNKRKDGTYGESERFVRGFCAKHYWDWFRGTISISGKPIKRSKPAGCKVKGCKRGGHLTKGYCYWHYTAQYQKKYCK